MDVIEHVGDQKRVLDELGRVLGPGGLLIVTVPQQYVLSFMDTGNLKFRFPRLHRFAYCRLRSAEEYAYRYVSNPDGLIGDVAASKAWHEHFTPQSLGRLLEQSGFEVVDFDGSAFFDRALEPLKMAGKIIPGLNRVLNAVLRADARAFASMNLYCTARKRVERSAVGLPRERHTAHE